MTSRPLAVGTVDLAAFYEARRARAERWSRRQTLAFIVLTNTAAWTVIIGVAALIWISL